MRRQLVRPLKCNDFHCYLLASDRDLASELLVSIRLRSEMAGKVDLPLKTVTFRIISGYYLTCSSGIDSAFLYRF